MISMPETRKKLRTIYWSVLLVNISALIFGILYLSAGFESIFWNLYGLFILAALIGNIYIAYIEDPRNLRGYLYLVFSGICLLLIPIFNSLASFTITHYSSRSIVSCALVFALFLSGGLLAVSNLICRKTEAEILLDDLAIKKIKESHRQKAIKTIIIICLSIILAAGLAVAYRILVINEKFWTTEVFISAVSLFYAFVSLSVGVLILKLLPGKGSTLAKIVFSLVILFVFIVCLLPFAVSPFMVKNAETEYIQAFGEEFLASPEYDLEHFRKVRFSIPEYFFGIVSEGFAVRKDIPFYQGTEGVDKGLRLYFDAYTPIVDGDTLPGGNSVLVRIHGGGWTSGDKGFLNNAQINKYFASQGYAVFDIQYGLSKKNGSAETAESPYGDFTTDDMVRHIGKFLEYLSKHSEEFNANIDSVFISGASAGGNLALASGLALAGNKYSNIPGREVKIRGLIPYYPANELADNFGVGYSLEFNNPGLLVNELSPPCLIFQGSSDGLVKYSVTEKFKNAYIEAGNMQCAVISMPFGGHACDMYFPGYYNQLFLYYMERFMYVFR